MNLVIVFFSQIVLSIGIYFIMNLKIDKAVKAEKTIQTIEDLVRTLNRYADKNLTHMQHKIGEFKKLERDMTELRRKLQKVKLLPGQNPLTENAKVSPQDEILKQKPYENPKEKTPDTLKSVAGVRSEQAVIERLVASRDESFKQMSLMEKVFYLYSRGMKQKEIAAKLKISQSEVTLYLHMRQNHETGHRN